MTKKNKTLSFEELHNLALKEARKIHRSSTEHGIAIDEYGIITKFGGDGNAVYINITKSTRITVHNHPDDYKEPSSISGADAYNLLHYGLDEIIVCGYGHCFCMRRGDCISRAIIIKNDMEKIYKNIQKIETKQTAQQSDTDLKSIKKNYKEMHIRIEREYHESLVRYTSGKLEITQSKEPAGKGLFYEKAKL